MAPFWRIAHQKLGTGKHQQFAVEIASGRRTMLFALFFDQQKRIVTSK